MEGKERGECCWSREGYAVGLQFKVKGLDERLNRHVGLNLPPHRKTCGVRHISYSTTCCLEEVEELDLVCALSNCYST